MLTGEGKPTVHRKQNTTPKNQQTSSACFEIIQEGREGVVKQAGTHHIAETNGSQHTPKQQVLISTIVLSLLFSHYCHSFVS